MFPQRRFFGRIHRECPVQLFQLHVLVDERPVHVRNGILPAADITDDTPQRCLLVPDLLFTGLLLLFQRLQVRGAQLLQPLFQRLLFLFFSFDLAHVCQPAL